VPTLGSRGREELDEAEADEKQHRRRSPLKNRAIEGQCHASPTPRLGVSKARTPISLMQAQLIVVYTRRHPQVKWRGINAWAVPIKNCKIKLRIGLIFDLGRRLQAKWSKYREVLQDTHPTSNQSNFLPTMIFLQHFS